MPNEPTAPPASVEDRLRALEIASDARRAELQALIRDVPAAVSRRQVLQSVANDLRAAPNKGEIIVRAGRKIGRTPGALIRRLTHRN